EALNDGIACDRVTRRDLTEDQRDAHYRFYMDTGSRKWDRPYLNRELLSRLWAAMVDRIVMMLARDGAEDIASELHCLRDETLYGGNGGAIRDVPFLHFGLCYYQAIDFAMAHGLKRVEAGAQGQHTLARGYAPATTRSIHHIVHP